MLLFTQRPAAEALQLQQRRVEQGAEGRTRDNQLLLMEHPKTWRVNESLEDGPTEVQAAAAGAHWIRAPQTAPVEYYAPGQWVGYATYALDRWQGDLGAFTRDLEAALLGVLADFDLPAVPDADGALIRTAAGVVAGRDVLGHHGRAIARFWIHINTEPAGARELVDAGWLAPVAPLTTLGVPIQAQDKVREGVLRWLERRLGGPIVLPQRDRMRAIKPPWLRAKMPGGRGSGFVRDIIHQSRLHTVCESAHCPNRGECWRHGTATFMIGGDVCTRSCAFCAVFTGRPRPLDEDEPRRVALAAAKMHLEFVVLTSVDRDDLPDGGAGQFVRTLLELRARIPGVKVEVLIPDFKGLEAPLDAVFQERPEVLNHNVETVPERYRRVRPQARYERSLEVIRRAKAAGLTTKSGFMLGLGETEEQVTRLLHDLKTAGCDIVTIGQYLRPSERHHPVIRYATPSEFERWAERGRDLGFSTVESGPLVRSSYHAHQAYQRHNGPAATTR